ncbi:uncharacterized protein [Miscanthus floridulus]|uniref:uncharacterized protein n=1 Tax=Miscanthus floridulus TaxID=154761 RepID=UPI0034592D31
MDEQVNDTALGQDIDGAAIPTSDAVPGEMVITYDKKNPSMEVGTMYPTMEEFKLPIQQFAINKEFHLRVEKSTKTVTVLVNDHTCVSSMRMATTTPNYKWVALWAASILRAEPNIGARELQKRLEIDHKCEIAYDTVWRGKAKALDEVYGKWSESFQLLYRWKAEVEKRSPGSVVEIDVLEVDGELKKAIGDPPLLAICSDACKGLENAVKNVFPNAEQRECFYHLARNFKKRFRGFIQIYPATRAYREEIFYDNLAKMLSESSEAVQWLQANHKLLWYRCGFNPDIKCDYIASNIAESFNNWIRDHKDLPVADLADKIREIIMVLWHKRRIIAYRLPEGRILPAIMVQLRANTRGLGHLKIVKCSNWSAEVWDHSSGVSVRHIVKLEQRTCTCQEWQHTGKPCQHVLAYVTRQRGIDLEQFVHDYYSVNRFRAAYGREIEPMTDKTQWPEVDLPFLVGAPLAKLPPRRLRKLRIKGWMEGGHKKKGSKDEKFTNEMEGEKGCDNDTAPTNAKGKKMIRGPMTCKKEKPNATFTYVANHRLFSSIRIQSQGSGGRYGHVAR